MINSTAVSDVLSFISVSYMKLKVNMKQTDTTCNRKGSVIDETFNDASHVWLGRREEAQKSAAIPVNELKALLNLAREQYLQMHDSTLSRASERMCLEKEKRTSSSNTSGEEYYRAVCFKDASFVKKNYNNRLW